VAVAAESSRMDGSNTLAIEGSSGPDPPQTNDQKRNIDSYYERRVGLCQTVSLVLNAGLMLYAHIGLSGVVLSSVDFSVLSTISENNIGNDSNIAACNEQDEDIWTSNGGLSVIPTQTDFCITSYNDGGCLTNVTCTESCFKDTNGYSNECAVCFGAVLPCGVSSGCTFTCIADIASAECWGCLAPCVEKFSACSGLPDVGNVTILQNASALPSKAATGNNCNSFDLDAIETWYNAYDITFIRTVKDSWNNGAKFLACVIVLLSGVWPYAKNILVLIVWYLPMTVERRTSALLWLSWLSKYTLVDVFAVIVVFVSVQLQLNIGGVVETVVRAEPRFGIICFFLATLWEFFQIELVKAMHERKVGLAGQVSQDEKKRLSFSQLWISVLVILTAIGLYAWGITSELVYFTSVGGESEGFCVKSHNLVQLGNSLINDISMTGNSAAGQTWFLYLVYVVLNLMLPIITHLMQIIYIAGHFRSKRMESVIHFASAIWCFACIEVLLIATFGVNSKFGQFIHNVSGIQDEDFLDISMGLGNGVYILIAYSVVACGFQFSLGKINDSSTQSTSKGANMGEEESDPM